MSISHLNLMTRLSLIKLQRYDGNNLTRFVLIRNALIRALEHTSASNNESQWDAREEEQDWLDACFSANYSAEAEDGMLTLEESPLSPENDIRVEEQVEEDEDGDMIMAEAEEDEADSEEEQLQSPVEDAIDGEPSVHHAPFMIRRAAPAFFIPLDDDDEDYDASFYEEESKPNCVLTWTSEGHWPLLS
ncbi:uncharacterized protein BYT42DRAFT_580859 [Radiomyces spectabilis]|uniref:uncharacterized protein n=1 Tax=Radiomyces spectabilis TaxID=64574 RepID=UPI00221E6E58|nr:uncharacterized protein BYT42DRAFT_580859 [Radiomyces spectabilis]KAI8371611.1 hypothetical protein BYT42DRAFT_580859 [Radiomyces spectabilis]